ncbi:MAG: hypothetical protein QOE34_1383 [Verrucomicrobiota bacterium]|jgi:hypothetical protein
MLVNHAGILNDTSPRLLDIDFRVKEEFFL